MSLEEMADIVAAHVRRTTHTASGWWVVGHSLGGKVGALAALRHRNLFAGVVCVDISLLPYDVGSREWRQLHHALHVMTEVEGLPAGDGRSWRSRLDHELAARGIDDGGLRGHVGVNAIAQAAGPGLPSHIRWRVPARVLLDNLPAFADFPAAPPTGPYEPADDVQFHAIRGGASPYAPFDAVVSPDSTASMSMEQLTPRAQQERAAYRAFFPQAHFHTVPSAGHFVMGEQPNAFAAVLAAILPRLPPNQTSSADVLQPTRGKLGPS